MVEPNKTTVSDNTENGAHNMVKLTIDNCEVVVPEHTTILDAAKSVGIQIPTLCYLRDLNEIGGCRVCVVEVEGCDQLVAACNNYVLDGMVVYTDAEQITERVSFAEASADDCVFRVKDNGSTVRSITMGSRALVRDTEYRIGASANGQLAITLTNSFLTALTAGSAAHR